MLARSGPKGEVRLKQARLLSLLIPAALLGGAFFSQYVGGLYPCEMCYWQRWPHGAAILLALISLASPIRAARTRLTVLLAAFLIAVSGAIGIYHGGVEMGWWEGITVCTATGAKSLQDIMNVPLIRCDQVQWTFLGLSLAWWNAIISLGGAMAITMLASRKAR